MAILRKEKKNNFTIIDNAIFRDCSLSYKAKGLLCQMLSLPDGWEWSIEGLATLSTDGKSAVTSALEELKEAGYFRREQKRIDGKMAGVEYVVSETKMSDFPLAENPSTVFPSADNPSAENRTQLNTNTSSTKGLRTNPSSTKGILSEFENLWKLYPRKHGKKNALDSYIRARKSGTTYEEVEKGIKAYANYVRAERIEERYIKHGSSFFSQQSWQDEWVTHKADAYEDEERAILEDVF